jgi:hypothetical protein
MVNVFKKIFCWFYAQWLSKVVGSKTAPVVVALDAAFGSQCKYCMSARALFAGFGGGLLFVGDSFAFFAGVGLIALALAMTAGEKYWLCDVKGDPNETKPD